MKKFVFLIFLITLTSCAYFSPDNKSDLIGEGAIVVIYRYVNDGSTDASIIFNDSKLVGVESGVKFRLMLDNGTNYAVIGEPCLKDEPGINTSTVDLARGETKYLIFSKCSLNEMTYDEWSSRVASDVRTKTIVRTTVLIVTAPIWIPVSLIAYLIGGD